MSTETEGRGILYMSGDSQTWAEIGWTEGAITFLPPPAAEPMPFITGPRTWTATFHLDRVHRRRLKRWLRSAVNPRPLCIDGHEYRRRQRARRRHGR